MIFAFLPTAVLYICSCAGFITSLIMIFPSPFSSFPLCALLFLCSSAGVLLSYIAADTLDCISEEGFLYDFDRSFSSAIRRSRRCFGAYRIVSLLDTAYYCCAYEKLPQARETLLEAKRLIEKSSASPYRATYLYLVLEYKKKSHDTNNISSLISLTADNISSARYITRKGRNSAEQSLVYSVSQLELYSHTAEELMNSRRDIAERIYRLTAEGIRTSTKGNRYKKLCFIYDHALSCLLTNRAKEAESCIDALSRTPTAFPLSQRIQDYIISRDISVLMQTTP